MPRQLTNRDIRAIDCAIEKAFAVHFDRVQIPIMDIPKIYREAREAFASGAISIDDAIANIAARYKADHVAKGKQDHAHLAEMIAMQENLDMEGDFDSRGHI